MKFLKGTTRSVLIFVLILCGLNGAALAGPSDVGEAIVGMSKVAAPPVKTEVADVPKPQDAGVPKNTSSDTKPEAVNPIETAQADGGVTMSDKPGELPNGIEKDPIEVTTKIVKDIKSGNWKMVAAGVLVLIMLGVARFRDKIKFFRGDRGGAILVATISLTGAVITSLYAGVAIDLAMVLAAFGTTWTAVGGRDWVKTIMNPPDQQLERAETIDE